MNYLTAMGLCIVAAAIEGLCSGRGPMSQLSVTKQPSWSPPNWVWVLIGFAWYGICFVALARLLALWPASRMPVALLVVLMLANGGANIFQFRMKRLDLAFLYLFPYWLVLAAFIWAAWPLDQLTCGLFAAYAAYQVYAAFWGYALWRMNPRLR